MKDTPEIAPEIRGLLEEIVADPRSAIRLVPRRALRTWFDTGERVRASDVVRTSAERHLVEMHREELAALLCEASRISYWKSPVLTCRPVGEDGSLYDPTELEPAWRERAQRTITTCTSRSDGIDLLKQCLAGIRPQQGWVLGQASLALVPRDIARFYIALSVPWSRPRPAIALLDRFARTARPLTIRLEALLSLAARTCALGLIEEARDVYREAAQSDPKSQCAWICAFNLSCFIGQQKAAAMDADGLESTRPEDPRVAEMLTCLGEWIRSRSARERSLAAATAKGLHGRITETARVICREYE